MTCKIKFCPMLQSQHLWALGWALIRGYYDYDTMNNKMNVHTDSAAALIRLETLCHE